MKVFALAFLCIGLFAVNSFREKNDLKESISAGLLALIAGIAVFYQ